jgi:LysM repeat protein
MPGIAENCDRFYKIKSGDTCDAIAQSNSITVAQLRSWNTEINTSCSNLWLDYYICTHVPGAVQPSTTSTAPTPSNSPTMPGIAENCDRFYKIKSGDTCDAIASSNGITVAQLRSWNTEINAGCSNLWLDYYICTHVPGAAQPSTTSSAPTPSNSPTLPGAVSNCNKWYKIVSGDTCEKIAAKNTITVDQFRSWNTQINTSTFRPLNSQL